VWRLAATTLINIHAAAAPLIMPNLARAFFFFFLMQLIIMAVFIQVAAAGLLFFALLFQAAAPSPDPFASPYPG
jgi:hypothetical protein